MSKKNLPVIKVRFIALTVSIVMILISVFSMTIGGGFNTGIDFESGLSQRIQVAPVGLEVTYNGSSAVEIALESNFVTITTRSDAGAFKNTFSAIEYPTSADLAKALETVDGVSVNVVNGSLATGKILSGYGFPATLNKDITSLNFEGKSGEVVVAIDVVRAALSDLSGVQVQTVGNSDSQIFQVRIGTKEGDTQSSMEKSVNGDLAKAFTAEGFVVLESNFIGPKFSNSLISGSILAVFAALVLILIYVWIRFKIAYALSSIIALTHDVLILLGFIALFKFEVSSTTIAAVLTIIGYSLNATIVIFDRVRENRGLMKGIEINEIIEHSVTQTLSRTILSSLTTVLAVLPLALLATGSIRLFAVEMMFGIVVGTYSSNFIAPSFLYWISAALEKKKNKR
ncbi:MAG: protein translocase subunit SecF [Spirochaetaceae bacterium]|nr:protein translocase subunit SecF [Spirochaetaceae bacterium]